MHFVYINGKMHSISMPDRTGLISTTRLFKHWYFARDIKHKAIVEFFFSKFIRRPLTVLHLYSRKSIYFFFFWFYRNCSTSGKTLKNGDIFFPYQNNNTDSFHPSVCFFSPKIKTTFWTFDVNKTDTHPVDLFNSNATNTYDIELSHKLTSIYSLQTL